MTPGKRTYVLDTNVLIHDPTALFKFEEHDVFLPIQVIEELDNAKKGSSEISRNARQVSRFLDALINNTNADQIETGIPLSPPESIRLKDQCGIGKLYFQTQSTEPRNGLRNIVPDNNILAAVLTLHEQHSGDVSHLGVQGHQPPHQSIHQRFNR
nr:PIN domain-containing protein [Xylella fastidiosa]